MKTIEPFSKTSLYQQYGVNFSSFFIKSVIYLPENPLSTPYGFISNPDNPSYH